MDFLDKRVGVICNELKKLKVKQVFPLTATTGSARPIPFQRSWMEKVYGSAFPHRSTSGMTEEIRSLSCL